MKTKLTCMITLALAIAASAHAGSATWSLKPTSGDWNTAENWDPATVPNGSSDIATFAVSNTTDLSFSTSAIEVSSIIFNPGASSFNITLDPDAAQSAVTLTISGAGILNNSGDIQNLTVAPTDTNGQGLIQFLNSASAGEDTVLTLSGSERTFFKGGGLNFYDTASACSASISVGGGVGPDGDEPYGAYVDFYNSATAENAIFTIGGALVAYGEGGTVFFYDSSRAGDADFVIEGSSAYLGGELRFYDTATAGNATISVQAAPNSTGERASLYFFHHSSVDDAAITVEGGATAGASAGSVSFDSTVTIANATLIANGGSNGGKGASFGFRAAGDVTLVANGGSNGSEGGVISFDQVGAATLIANGGSNGGGGGSIGVGRAPGARAEVFGNGNLTCKPGATIGSLEGDGFVFLGGLLTVGTTNLSTEFSGSIQNSGSLTKSGTGTFTLTGTNTYTEGTTVLSGILSVNNPTGSGTGTGPVQVNAGTLGGTGTIAGAVTIGTGSGAGAFLETSAGVVKPSSLSIQGALIFKADSTYTYNLNTKRAKADKVIANGVTIENGAQFSFVASGKKTLTPGKKFIVISNTAATALAGTFTNLPDGGTITVGSNTFQISYEGGGGNDLTLTVVP